MIDKLNHMANKRVFFKGLNGLRFYAASFVVFHHVAQYKHWEGLNGIWGQHSVLATFVDNIGNKAVSLFFVLSGFLITYLLLEELRTTDTVQLKKFYIRRILRIWPLYYVIVLLTLFVLPHFADLGGWGELMKGEFTTVLVIHLLILPNLMRATPIQVVGANQTWSIGVEEQFYLVWPILIRWFRNYILQFLLVFIVLKMAIGGAGLYAETVTTGTLHTIIDKFNTIWELLMIEQMAIGAIGAWFLFEKKEKALNMIYAPITQVVMALLLAGILLTELNFYGSRLLEAIVFTVLIMNVSLNDKFPLKFNSKKYDLLGNMSYGIYMWHTSIIAVVIAGFRYVNVGSEWLQNVLLYTLPYILTLLMAYLSYKYLEIPFLKFKEKFMVVKSATSKKKE